jgi:hypothetical protein
VPSLPQDIERITMRLLERDPSCRYATAGAAIDALLACAAYPKNGRELLSALLRERLPGPRPPNSSSEETPSASTIAPLHVHREPYPDPFMAIRARRFVMLAAMTVAMVLTVILALRTVLRGDDSDAPAAQAVHVTPPVRLPVAHPPSSEARAAASPSAPSRPSVSSALPPSPANPSRPSTESVLPASPVPPVPTVAVPSSSASGIRIPARRHQAPAAQVPESKPDDGIGVIDLREVRDWAPFGGVTENRSPTP